MVTDLELGGLHWQNQKSIPEHPTDIPQLSSSHCTLILEELLKPIRLAEKMLDHLTSLTTIPVSWPLAIMVLE